MPAIEVPNAMCTSLSAGKPCAANSEASTGTMMPPPPTPSSPAKNPTNAPSRG